MLRGNRNPGGAKNYSADYEAEIQTSEKWKKLKAAAKEKGVEADRDFLRAMNAWNGLESECRAFETEIRRMERSGKYAKEEISEAVNAFEARKTKELDAWEKKYGKVFEEASALLNPKAETQPEAAVDETMQGGYNADDDFGRIQEESRRLARGTPWEQRSLAMDEDLRGRLSGVLGERIRSEHGDRGDVSRILNLSDGKGNEFNVLGHVDEKTFHDVFEVAGNYTNNGELVDLHDDYSGHDCYLSDNGLQGFAISESGDLVSVFNSEAKYKRGFLKSIAPVVKDKAATLDCYVSDRQNLQAIYSKVFGFKTAAIMDWNPEYDHDGIGANHGNPKVAFMVNTDEDVETKHFGKDQYDEAKAYQLSFAKKKANEGKTAEIDAKKNIFKRNEEYSRRLKALLNDPLNEEVSVESEKFGEALDDIRNSKGEQSGRLIISDVNLDPLFKLLKANDLETAENIPLCIRKDHLHNILSRGQDTKKSHFHQIENKQFLSALKSVNDPLFITKKSPSKIAVFTDTEDYSGNKILVCFDFKKERKSILLTMYGKRLTPQFFNKNQLAYLKPKLKNDLESPSESNSLRAIKAVSDYIKTNNSDSVNAEIEGNQKSNQSSIEEEISKRYGKDHASSPSRMVIEASNAKDGKVATKRSVLDMRKVVDEAVDDILSRGNVPGQKTKPESLSPADTQDLFAKINLADESRLGEIRARAFEKLEEVEVVYEDGVDGVRETYALKDLLDGGERAELRERFDEAFSDMLSKRKDSRLREFADRVSRLVGENAKVRERARIAAKTRDAFNSLANKLGIQGKESKLKTVLRNGSEADTDAISLFREVVKDAKISSRTGLSTSPKAANRLIEFNGKYTYERFGDSALWDPEIKNELDAVERLSENGRYRENGELGIEAQRHVLNLLKAINHRLNAETAQRVEANRAKARESAIAADMLAPSEGRYLGTMADKAENLPQYLSNHLGKENPLYAAVVEGWTKEGRSKASSRRATSTTRPARWRTSASRASLKEIPLEIEVKTNGNSPIGKWLFIRFLYDFYTMKIKTPMASGFFGFWCRLGESNL